MNGPQGLAAEGITAPTPDGPGPARPLDGTTLPVPHAGPRNLRRLLDAVVMVGTDLDLPAMLRRIVEAAVDLVDARYGALGVLDESGERLAELITVGVDEKAHAAIGKLPQGLGLLGSLITDATPRRAAQLSDHPDSAGFPPNHPAMTSFLGVPIRVRGEVFGNLYLTDKTTSEVFTDIDQELALGLAAAAGVAIENARYQELLLLGDQERVRRDLHDDVIQRLFSTGLTLQNANQLITDPQARRRVDDAVDQLDRAIAHIRTVVFDLETTNRDRAQTTPEPGEEPGP